MLGVRCPAFAVSSNTCITLMCANRFMSSFWAVVDLISHVFTAGWCGWYIILMLQDMRRDKVS